MADRVLIFGNGWIGNKLASSFSADISGANITDRGAVMSALDSRRPSVVINAAGKTGRPNIDGCEDIPAETLSSNVAGPIILAEECLARKIFMVHLGSGCIYDNSRSNYTESDPPNFYGSLYSRSKIISEEALKNLPVLQLRLRMPFDGKPHPRNFITKITSYERVISVENSLTCIGDLIVACEVLVAERLTGIWNVVNPGTITHERILDLYKELVDPDFKYEVMTLEELRSVTKVGRSNCTLSTKKLEDLGLKLPHIEIAVMDALQEYKTHKRI